MVTYCPHCAASNEYSLDKPKTCKKCGKSFAAAFKIYTEEEEEIVKPSLSRPKRRVIPSKVFNSDVVSEDDDPAEKQSIKEDLIAKLTASGGVRVTKPARNSVKIDELFKNPDIVDQFENPAGPPAPLDGQ